MLRTIVVVVSYLCVVLTYAQRSSFWWQNLSEEDSLVIEKLPINSLRDDFASIFFDNILLFSSNRQNRQTREEALRTYTNIYSSIYHQKQWSRPRMNYFFNTDDNTSVAGMSASRGTVFVYKGFGNGDLYRVERKPNGKWSSYRKLPRTVNSLSYSEQSAALASDVLYFSRQIDDDNFDLFYSLVDYKGKYHLPISFDFANSHVKDIDISVSSNGKVLYFSSNRNGNFDIYATWINEKNQWIEPFSLPSVNTFDDERWFFDADTMFFFTRRNENGYYDLWAGRIVKKQKKQQIEEIEEIKEIKDTLSYFEQKFRDLERALDSLQFRPYRARVQVGAYYHLKSVEQFVFFYPVFSKDELEVEKEKTYRGILYRFLIKTTYYTLREAAERQHIAKRQQTDPQNRYLLSEPDAFIAVYDKHDQRIIIYFDVERRIFKILKGDQIIYF